MGKNKDKLKNLRNLVNNIKNIDINKEKGTDQQQSMLNESSFDIAPQDTSHIHSENLEDRERKKSSEHVYKKGFAKKYQHTNSVLDYNHDNTQEFTHHQNNDHIKKLKNQNSDTLENQDKELPQKIPPPPFKNVNPQKQKQIQNQTKDILLLDQNKVNKNSVEVDVQIEIQKCIQILELKNQIQELNNQVQNKDIQLTQALLKIKQLENNKETQLNVDQKYDKDSFQNIQATIQQQNTQIEELINEFQVQKEKIQQNYENQINQLKTDYESTINLQQTEIEKLKNSLLENNKQDLKIEKIEFQLDSQDDKNQIEFLNELEKQIKQQNDVLKNINFTFEMKQIEFNTEEFLLNLQYKQDFTQNEDMHEQEIQQKFNNKDFQEKLKEINGKELIEEPQLYEGEDQKQFQIDENILNFDVKNTEKIVLQQQEKDLDQINQVKKKEFIQQNKERQDKTEQKNKKTKKVKINDQQQDLFPESKKDQQVELNNQNLDIQHINKQKIDQKKEQEIQKKIQEDLIFQKQNPPKTNVENLFSKNNKHQRKKVKAEEIFFDQTPEEGTNFLEIFDNLSHNHENFDNINDTQSQQDYYDQNDDLHSMKSLQIGSKQIKASNNPFKKSSKYSRQQKNFKKVQSLKKSTPQAKITNTIPDDLFQFNFIQYYELKYPL